MEIDTNHFQTKTINETANYLKTDLNNGLDDNQVKINQKKYGLNKLKTKPPVSAFKRFINQFKDLLVIILLIAAVIAFIPIIINKGHVDPAEWSEPFIILLVVFINATIGYVQESKAQKALDALKKLTTSETRVIRNGQIVSIPSYELTLGDLIFFEAGDNIYADARLADANRLQTIEASLTGESVSVNKSHESIWKANTPIGDQTNMVFSGTYVVNGTGKAIVAAISNQTQIGLISQMIDQVEIEKTPLQKQLNRFGKWLSIFCLIICLIVLAIQFVNLFINNKITWNTSIQAIMLAVSLAVAAIPEGLPIVVTINMSISVTRMAHEQALVKNLAVVETLGESSVICTDKTGTLTENKMFLTEIYDCQSNQVIQLKTLKNDLNHILQYGAMCSNASIFINNGIEETNGDPIEIAIIREYERIYQVDQNDLLDQCPRIEELPFDSKRKLMSVIHHTDKKQLVITKGAIDALVNLCQLNDKQKQEVISKNNQYSMNGHRVLGIAYKYLDENNQNFNVNLIENELTFLGLMIFIDPPRVEAKTSISNAIKAGINVVMITGDHILTAIAIAKEIGIYTDNDLAIDGVQLANISEDELQEQITKIKVFARVNPKDKLRIIKAWKKQNHVVAMIGDGINDAPALKGTDIGCAMGNSTDVAKDASDIILQNNNFNTVLSAIYEGRHTFNNILRIIRFLVATNLSEIIILLTLIVSGFILKINVDPLSPLQILWINMIGDSFPAIALSMEQFDPKLKFNKPINVFDGVFSKSLWTKIILDSLFLSCVTLISYFVGYGISRDGATASTCCFLTLGISQLTQTFNLKSNQSLFKTNIFDNMWLVYANLLALILILFVSLTPSVNTLFNMINMFDYNHWYLYLISLSLAILIPLIYGELSKNNLFKNY